MQTTYTEQSYENSVIELFQNMGYTHVYGPDIETRDFHCPLYEDILLDIQKCNETVRNITGHSPTLSRVPSEFSDIKKLPHTACRSLPYRGRKTFYGVFLCEQ